MAPQIKQDLNRSGWESTDFPSVCEPCLPENPFVQMLKEEYGAECKICTRPFAIFRWKADRSSRQRKTNICLTCARLKNCCQSCMLDLSFGLPIQIRDAALKLVAPGPESGINRAYYAQNNELAIADGRGGTEAYDETHEKAQNLLRRLANSNTFSRSKRMMEGDEAVNELPEPSGQRQLTAPGPVRSADSYAPPRDSYAPYPGAGRGDRPFRGGRGGRGAPKGRGGHVGGSAPPGPDDILPPDDKTITSLFITGIEEDLPEWAIRDFFTSFGKIKSLVCSHRSHCAFINYANRQAAEVAAEKCQGRAIIHGCPLRVRWGKPRPVGTMDAEERARLAKEGRVAAKDQSLPPQRAVPQIEGAPIAHTATEPEILPPPGADNFKYASQIGEG